MEVVSECLAMETFETHLDAYLCYLLDGTCFSWGVGLNEVFQPLQFSDSAEGTQNDHQILSLVPHRTIQNANPMSERIVLMLLELQQPVTVTTALKILVYAHYFLRRNHFLVSHRTPPSNCSMPLPWVLKPKVL